MGRQVLAISLTRIINASIQNGKFPDKWKESVVCPILKSGDPTMTKIFGWKRKPNDQGN